MEALRMTIRTFESGAEACQYLRGFDAKSLGIVARPPSRGPSVEPGAVFHLPHLETAVAASRQIVGAGGIVASPPFDAPGWKNRRCAVILKGCQNLWGSPSGAGRQFPLTVHREKRRCHGYHRQ